MIPSKYKYYINLFKQQLEVINAYYLSDHLTGIVRHEWVTYRDPERDWFLKEYVALLDNDVVSIIGMNESKVFYQIMNSDMRDVYLCNLISSLSILYENIPYIEEEDTIKINECIKEWKSELLIKYSKEEHIRSFMWTLLRCEYNKDLITKVETYIREILNLADSFSFYQFEYNGLYLELNDFINRKVTIKSFSGIFSNFTRYRNNINILPDQEIINIPHKISHYSLGDLFVNKIGKGVFESLKNCKKIILPKSINDIEWSFWNCRKLERIELPCNSWDKLYFKSIDGVLYSGDGKTLCAYPNARGNTYEVPEGVTTIRKFAFKSCDSIETLILPSSIKLIEVNAFYRCTKLKKVICNMPSQNFKFEGFIGDSGIVKPNWYYICQTD